MESVNKLLTITQNLSTRLDSITSRFDILEAHQRDLDPVVIADKIKELLVNTRLPFGDEILKNAEPLAKMEAIKRCKAKPLQWNHLQVKPHLFNTGHALIMKRRQSCIRKHMLSLLRVRDTNPETLQSIAAKLTITREQLEELSYEQEEEDFLGELCTPATFRMELGRGWTSFELNASARRVFLKSFKNSVSSGIYKIDEDLQQDEDYLEALDSHINSLKKKFKLTEAPLPPIDAQAIKKRHARNSRMATVSLFIPHSGIRLTYSL